VEGNYRLNWLLTSSLEDYFALRDRWYPGSKKAFSLLEKEEPGIFSLFSAALEEPRNLLCIKSLVTRVYEKTVPPGNKA
jgi:uncharacterized protein